MHPYTDVAADERPSPGLDVFAGVMRSVLRTRHDSSGDGPEALEEWTRADGYSWRWTTDDGMWQVTAGGVMDPRPLLHGPGGIWRVNVLPEHAGDVVLLMLRAAGGLPGPDMVVAHPRVVRYRRPSVRIRGQHFTVPAPAVEPVRALLLRPSDPTPAVPDGYVVVRTTSDEPDDDGRWVVVLPDGYHHHTYDPARRCLVPYETPGGGTALLLFDPEQAPGRHQRPVFVSDPPTGDVPELFVPRAAAHSQGGFWLEPANANRGAA